MNNQVKQAKLKVLRGMGCTSAVARGAAAKIHKNKLSVALGLMRRRDIGVRSTHSPVRTLVCTIPPPDLGLLGANALL